MKKQTKKNLKKSIQTIKKSLKVIKKEWDKAVKALDDFNPMDNWDMQSFEMPDMSKQFDKNNFGKSDGTW